MRQQKEKTDGTGPHNGPFLDSRTFERLRQRITSASGIFVPDDETSRFLLERRLLPRLRQHGALTFSEYEGLLDPLELEALLDAVAIHETYFFREKRQLKVFLTHIIPEVLRADRPLRIWSAGCSTGEEPYTIAILLAEEGLLGEGVEILGSDLSRRVIESGQRGVYGASSFRNTDACCIDKYFEKVKLNQWRIDGTLRAAVQFGQLNLISLDRGGLRRPMFRGGQIDVIFCRNVLMYFDDEANRATLRSFHSLLADGGYLLLGHAESLLPLGSGLKPVQIGHELVHRK